MENTSILLLRSLLLILCANLCLARSLSPVSAYDTQTFLQSWKEACLGGSSLVTIPKGKTVTLKPVTLSGPCKTSNIRINLMGSIVGQSNPSEWGSNPSSLITIQNVNGLTIDGSGTIYGRGSSWWKCENTGKGGCRGVPNSMRINGCKGVTMTGIKFVNPPNVHLGISDSQDVLISHVTITAPETSPNTDGIHVQKSQHVRILNCDIATGDDCVSIGTGTSNVNISEITCGPGHGISIGSLGENNSEATVSDVTVSNSWFIKTQTGARIKTWQGGSGYVKNIVFQHLTMEAVDRPIVIDQFYCNGNHNCGTEKSAVQISSVKFMDIHGSSTQDDPISLECSKTVPCTDITIDDVQISANGKQASSYCLNVRGTAKDVSPTVSCLN